MKRKPRICPVGHRYYNKRGECQHCRAMKDRRCNDYFRALSEEMLAEAYRTMMQKAIAGQREMG